MFTNYIKKLVNVKAPTDCARLDVLGPLGQASEEARGLTRLLVMADCCEE